MGQALTQGLSPPADPSVRTLQPSEKGAVRYTGANGAEHQPVANDAKSADEGFRREVAQRWLEEDKALAEQEMKDLLVNSEQRIASLTDRLDNIRKVHDAQMQALEEEIERVEGDIAKGSKDDQVTATLMQNLEVLKQTKNNISARHTHDISYVITTASRGYPQPRPELHEHHHHPIAPRPRPGVVSNANMGAGPANGGANMGTSQATGSRPPASSLQPATHKSAAVASRGQRVPSSAVRHQPAPAAAQHPPPSPSPQPSPQQIPAAVAPQMATVTYDLSGAAPESMMQEPAPAFVPAPAQSLPQLPPAHQHAQASVSHHGHPYYDPSSAFDGFDAPVRANGAGNQGLAPMTMGT